MAPLVPQQIGYTGSLPTLGAANASDTVAADDRVFLWVKNTNAATRNIVISAPPGLDKFGQTFPDISVTIAATTGEEMIGPMVGDLAVDGIITITPSATAGVTIAAVRV
jgi:hypothetical protein